MSLINAAACALLLAAFLVALSSGEVLLVLAVVAGTTGAIAISGQAEPHGPEGRL